MPTKCNTWSIGSLENCLDPGTISVWAGLGREDISY
jgi:hypothetical protein